jgi:hypothetical protein
LSSSRRSSGVDRLHGEDAAVDGDAVAGAVGRGEVAVFDPDRFGQRAEMGECAKQIF